MMLKRIVSHVLRTASISLAPRLASVIQCQATYSDFINSFILSEWQSRMYVKRSQYRIMQPTTIPAEYALKNTQVIENDNTLNREAGRKTEIFLIMASKPKIPPLAVT